MRQKSSDLLFRCFRVFYYHFLFGRRFPYAKQLAEMVYLKEQRRGHRDIPAAGGDWDTQYSAGEWDYMEETDETARYDAIISSIRKFKPGGSILDVGCGAGILFKRCGPSVYSKYVGIDISPVALRALIPKQDGQTVFIAADAETYTPEQRFDTIVFNESLYYFREPLAAARRYSGYLSVDGIIIVSTYTSSRRALAILRELRKQFSPTEEILTTHEKTSWLCSTFTPNPAQSSSR